MNLTMSPAPPRYSFPLSLAACVSAILLLLSLSFATENDHAWELFVIDESGALWLLDKTVRSTPGDSLKSLWIRYMPVRRTPAQLDDGRNSTQGTRPGVYDYSNILWTVDCGAGRFKTLRIVRFDRDGRILDDRAFEGSTWSQSTKGTIPDRIIEKVCGNQPL